MKIGYKRVSKQEQNEALQKDALKDVGCEKYFGDKITGSKQEQDYNRQKRINLVLIGR
jgi:DNA invertase Pin-like site-specific DNA recombinase